MDDKDMKEMWQGREQDILYRIMREKIKNMRISEFHPDTLRKRIGEEAKRLMIPKEIILNATKVIVRQILKEALSELEKLDFSKR